MAAAETPERAESARRAIGPGGTPLAWWAGGAGAPALLLVHGLASNASRWAEFCAESQVPARHVRVDLRGHGQAQPAAPATLEDWCADLADVLDAEGADEGAVVVGHSLGAQVALHFGARYPQRVAGLVLIDPVFRGALVPKWARIARYAPAFAAAARIVRGLNRIGLTRRRVVPDDLRAMDVLAREALTDPAREAAFVARYSSTRHDLANLHTAQYLQDLVEMFRAPPELSSIRVPVLVLLSTGATFADPAAMRAELARLPQAEVGTIECHHWPVTEKPAEVRRAVEQWWGIRIAR